jgi:hypothetical protein
MEVISQAALSRRRNLITEEQLHDLREDGERLARMLSGLRSKILNAKR